MLKIIKFEKADCVPCSMVSKVLIEGRIAHETINAFESPETAARYKVRSLPTVLVLENEVEVKRIVGVQLPELLLLKDIQG